MTGIPDLAGQAQLSHPPGQHAASAFCLGTLTQRQQRSIAAVRPGARGGKGRRDAGADRTGTAGDHRHTPNGLGHAPAETQRVQVRHGRLVRHIEQESAAVNGPAPPVLGWVMTAQLPFWRY